MISEIPVRYPDRLIPRRGRQGGVASGRGRTGSGSLSERKYVGRGFLLEVETGKCRFWEEETVGVEVKTCRRYLCKAETGREYLCVGETVRSCLLEGKTGSGWP